MAKILITLLATVLASCSNSTQFASVEFRPGSKTPVDGFSEMSYLGEIVYISDEIALTEHDIKSSKAVFNSNPGEKSLRIIFNENGTTRFAELTKRSIGKPVGFFIDGQLICVGLVMSVINDGKVILRGHFSKEEAENIVSKLPKNN